MAKHYKAIANVTNCFLRGAVYEDKHQMAPLHKGPKMADSERQGSQAHKTLLYFVIRDTQWPIIYCPEYNIGFLGLEKLHPFDAGKWGRVFVFLKEAGMVREDTTIQPKEATTDDLLMVHPRSYIDSLRWSLTVAGITEIPPVAMLPNFVVQKKVLRPFRYQTGGTILAGKVAMERGWAINIGGGFHHCSAQRGGGFCAYADITLTLRFLFESNPSVKKAMIIDLDAHQGNGHARDFMEDERVYILDVYNRNIYPHDGFAKRGIRRKVEVTHMIGDEEYLSLVRRHVEGALNEFHPDIVVFNAGTDILEGDPLGCMAVTAQGIVERDQIVFQKTVTRGIPIIMVTSGGYQQTTARIIADSILNLRALGLITCDAAESLPAPEPEPVSNIPRSASEGGLWAKFKRSANCMNLTRSQTSEHLARTGQQPSPDDAYRPAVSSSSSTSLNQCVNPGYALEPSGATADYLGNQHSQSYKPQDRTEWVDRSRRVEGEEVATGRVAGQLGEENIDGRLARGRDDKLQEVDEEGMDMLTFMAQMKQAQYEQDQNKAHGYPVT